MYGGLLVCVVFWDICNTQKHCETHCWGERTMINVVCAVETTEMRIKSKQRMIKLFTDLFISLKFFNLTFLWIWSNRFINVPLSITRSITSFQSSNAKNIYNLTPKNGKGWAVEWEKENPLTPSVYSCDLCPLGWSDAKACFAVIAADMLYRHCMFYKKKLSVKTWVWVWRWCYCSVFSAWIHSGPTTSMAGRIAGSCWRTTLWVITSLRMRGSMAAGARCASARPSSW